MTTNWAERLGAKELRVFKELQKKYEREKQPPEDFPKGFRESDYGKFESLFPEFRVRDMVKRPPVSPGMATRDVFNPFRPQPSMQPQMTSAAQTGTQPFDIKQPISEPMPSQREPFNPFRYNRQEALRGSFQPPDQPLAEIISGQVGESRNIPAEEAIKRITSQPEPGEANWLDRLGEVGDDPAQLIPFVSSVAEFGKLSAVNRAAIALEAGEPVSEIELKLLTEFLNKAQSDKTWGYKVMDVVTQMPAFAGEIAATGGLFTGAKEVTEKAATSALKRLIGSAIERKLPQLLIKGTAGLTAAGIAGVPPAIVRTPAGTQEKQVIGTLTGNDEEVWKSAVKAFGSAWVETASERTGGALGALTDPIKGQMLKSALLRTILRLNPGKTPSQVNSVFQRFGYNGVLGEMFEERVADVGHGVLTGLGLGDEPFKLPSLEQLSVELVSFSVPGVAQRLAEGIPEAAQFAREQPERGAIGGEGEIAPESKISEPIIYPEVTPPKAVARHKMTYGAGKSINFVEYEYNRERYITGTVVRGTDKSLGWYFGKGTEGLKEANRIALLSDEEFSNAEDLAKYSWAKTRKALTEVKPSVEPAVTPTPEVTPPVTEGVTQEPSPEAPQRITQPVSEGVTKSIKQWVGDKVPEIQSLDERTGQIIFKDGTTGELGIDVSDVITLHNINLESKGKGVGTKIFNAIREYADAKQKNIRVSKAYNKGFWTKMGFDIDKLGDYPKIPFRQPSPEAPQAIQRPVSEEVVPEIPVEELREQVKAKLAAQPVVEKAPVVSPAERMAEIQGLLKEPAKNLPAGTTKIALRKELAEINKSLIPQEKKLRSQIMASVKAKSLGVTQSRGIFRDTGGSRYLTNMELTQLEKVFRAIQRARPKKIGGKTVVTEGTEKAIQTLKTNLIQENSLSEQSYKDIMAFLRLKTDKLESPARFIGEREAKELIRTMNFEAEVGLLKHDVEVAKGLEDKPGLAKELKSISNQADETASLTVNKGVKISPWWDMWVYNERLQNRTGEPFYDIYRMMLDKRLANVTKSETIFKDIMDSTPEFNVIATNKESLTKVNNYIASRLGEDVKVVDMSEGEIALAKKIEEVLFSFRNSVRYNRFITTYSANEGDITKMNTDIPNAPRADLIEASRIYESGGAARLTEYLNTKTWGVINTGYEPHIVVNPKLQLRRIKASILPKGMLKTRDGITFDAGEKTILDRTHTYINRMLNLELEPYLRKLDITLQKASPKLREPGKTANDLSLMIDEMKGTFYISEPLARFIAKGGGYASSVVYLAPHLGFRNLFQNAAMYPDRTALVDPRNVKLTQDEQDFFETYVDQSRQFTQQFLLQGELGTGEIANLLRRVSFMGVSEKVNNIWAFWAGVNKGNRALDSYQKTGDVGKFINESGMKDLTLRQQKEVLELMALGKESEAVRLIARKINHNTNMIYDRAQGAPVTMGTSGRLLGSLLNFTRGYGQRLTQQIGKLSPGHTMAEKRHATKILMGLAVFGIAAGTLYQKITGKKQNPYNPLLMLSWSPGGLAVGAMIDAADVIGNIMQAITGDKDALTRIPTDLARSGDLLIPFYGVLLNIIESLSDTKFIDRLVLRKVLALLKKDYKPNEAYYQKERDWVGKLQHALFGGEPAEPIEPDTTNPFREPSSENKNPFRKTTARENPFR